MLSLALQTKWESEGVMPVRGRWGLVSTESVQGNAAQAENFATRSSSALRGARAIAPPGLNPPIIIDSWQSRPCLRPELVKV
jgi:hypothetical protein